MPSNKVYIILSFLVLSPSSYSLPAPAQVSSTHDVVSGIENSSSTTSIPTLHETGRINLTSIDVDKKTVHKNDYTRTMSVSNATIAEVKRDDAPINDPSTQDWRDRMVEFTWSHEGMDLDVWINKRKQYGSVKINVPPQYRKEKRGRLDRGFRIGMGSWNDWRPRGELYFWIEDGHEFWMGGDFTWDQKQIVGEEMKIIEW